MTTSNLDSLKIKINNKNVKSEEFYFPSLQVLNFRDQKRELEKKDIKKRNFGLTKIDKLKQKKKRT